MPLGLGLLVVTLIVASTLLALGVLVTAAARARSAIGRLSRLSEAHAAQESTLAVRLDGSRRTLGDAERRADDLVGGLQRLDAAIDRQRRLMRRLRNPPIEETFSV